MGKTTLYHSQRIFDTVIAVGFFFFFGLSAVGGNRVQRGNTMCERRKEEGFNNSYRLHEEGSTLKTSIQPLRCQNIHALHTHMNSSDILVLIHRV